MVERGPVNGGGAQPIVERAEDTGRVHLALGSVQAGPPGEEDLGHEVQNELLGLFGGMNRREKPGDLTQGPELEHGVVERGLSLEQDAPELQHHAETERQRHGHRAHLFRYQGVGVDDDLGLAAGEPGHLDRGLEAGGRPHPGQRFGR